MHGVARADACDIEIVLGTSAATHEFGLSPAGRDSTYIYHPPALHVWALDFNQCQPISMDEMGVNQAIKSYSANDPYFPKPPVRAHGQSEELVRSVFEKDTWS